MAEMKWTKAQRKVIEIRARNVLVSAAAGSGKTAVLVERILSMISDPIHPLDVDRLLVVTFTNAAAAQMRERIAQAVAERAAANPGNTHLQKQKNLVHGAKITTIHSFCMSVLRNYFGLIDLDPGFRMGEEAELALMKSDAAGELLEEKYGEADPRFLSFIEFYSTGKSDRRLGELLIQLSDFAEGYPWPEDWLLERRRDFQIADAAAMEQTGWMKELLQYIRFAVAGLPERLSQARALCMEKEGPEVYLDALLSDGELLDRLLAAGSYRELYPIFSGLSFQKLRPVSKKAGVREDLKERVQRIRKGVKETLEDIRKNFFFQPPEAMAGDLKRCAPVMEELAALTLAFQEVYRKRKEENRVLDYSDLEHLALKILVERREDKGVRPTRAAEELSGYYEEILIDEYQDSNLVQELLLNSISRERKGRPNVFMVGDVKQSIYKFRLARPELFMEKFDSYRKWEDGDSLYQRVDLHKNFRSRREVIEGVNLIFRRIMRRELGGITYDEESALHAGLDFPETEENAARGVECSFVLPPKEDGVELGNARQLEAEMIAARLRELTDPDTGVSVYDGDRQEYRRASYGDIVILLRTMAGWAEDFTEVLNARGIPAYTDTRSGYFSATEVRAMLDLLKIIDNPRQDIPLAAVLHSPVGGFAAKELAVIRGEFQGVEYYDALTAYRDRGERKELREKAAGFLDMLERYREMAAYTDIHRLLEQVMEDTGYYDYVSVMPAGERRRANLDMLVEKAVEFEATSYRGLFDFNRYMERLHKYEIDFGEAASEAGGGVRIMSIHKSKGLEFPIVIAAGLGKSFNMQDSRSRLVIHPDLGIGPDFVDPILRVKAPTLLKKAIQKQLVLEGLGEELRVLYVAFTRAKELLLLTGFAEDREQTEAVWREDGLRETPFVPYYQLAEARSALDFLGPCLYRPEGPSFPIRYVEGEELLGKEIGRQLKNKAGREGLLNWNADRVWDASWREGLSQAFSYRYPYEEERKYPAKMTVTELKRIASGEEEESAYPLERRPWEPGAVLSGPPALETEEGPLGEAPIPRFLNESAASTAAGRGSLYHRAMEWLDLPALLSGRSVREELSRLLAEGRLNEGEGKELRMSWLEGFLKTDLAKRMARAQAGGLLKREQKFVMGLPVSRLYPLAKGKDLILVQGMIDAFFWEEDGLVLVDYKTDRVALGEEALLLKRYRPQFDYYEEALSRMARRGVTERYLYSFSLGRALRI